MRHVHPRQSSTIWCQIDVDAQQLAPFCTSCRVFSECHLKSIKLTGEEETVIRYKALS